MEKLWAHGSAMVGASNNISLGDGGLRDDTWRESYLAQGEQKRAQVEAMIRYAQSSHCRMATLVRHFGDLADSQKPCGICDFCAPESCVAQQFRPATEAEQTVARGVLDALAGNGRSVGQLHTELCANKSPDRDAFEELLGAMARAGLIRLTDAVFEKDGKQIPFRKAHLTRDAQYVDGETPLELTIRATGSPAATRTRKKKAAVKTKKKKATIAARRNQPNGEIAASRAERPGSHAEHPRAEQLLRTWRTALAKRHGIPAFRIMSDKVLPAIAENQPRNAAELLAISGIGIATVEKYGAQLYKILYEARSR